MNSHIQLSIQRLNLSLRSFIRFSYDEVFIVIILFLQNVCP